MVVELPLNMWVKKRLGLRIIQKKEMHQQQGETSWLSVNIDNLFFISFIQ
jgi:hypothetical protein